MPKKDTINELCEVLSTALANRPDLKSKTFSLLGGRSNVASPGKGMTHAARKQAARHMFNKLSLKERLKEIA